MKKFTAMVAAAVLLAGCGGMVVRVGGDRHPAYLHALSDLRAARWSLEHRPGGFRVSEDENAAVGEIGAVIRDIKQAAYDDGRNLDEHPAADEALDYRGRLHHALDLLNRTHHDLSQPEDNPSVRGLRNRSIAHLDRAIRLVKKALFDAHFD